MGKRKFTDEQEQEICRRYLDGESSVQLVGAFGSTTHTITAVLKRNSVKRRSISTARGGIPPELEAEACRRYEAGEKISQIGASLGVSAKSVTGTLLRNGVTLRPGNENTRKFTDEQEQEICERYLSGESLTRISKSLGVNTTLLSSALRRNGIESRGSRKLTDDQEVCRRYLAGETSAQLAKAFGVHAGTVYVVLRRNGILRTAVTDEQAQEVCRRYLAGETFRQISNAVGIGKETARQHLAKRGIKARGRKIAAEAEPEICRRYLAGENCVEIAEDFDVSAPTIKLTLLRNGVATRTTGEAQRKIKDEQEPEICRLYLEGRSIYQIGEAFGVTGCCIAVCLDRNGIKRRSNSEAQGGLPPDLEPEVCRRYLDGENTVQLGAAFDVCSGTIGKILKRNGIELRASGVEFGDSVQHIIEGTGHHTSIRECEFYLFELARYSDTHCKPGIAFDVERRASRSETQGEYGAEVLRLVFATRAEALFLEQAVLDATRGSVGCPDDLINWTGATEIRAMPAEDMVPIVLRLAEELEELGMWEFAARYVPMTAAQRATCQQRALIAQEVA